METIILGLLALGLFPSHVGMVNSAEGEVTLDGTPVRPNDVGSARIAPGDVIKTGEAMAEVLLDPGSILRLGNRSELTFVASGTAEVQARLSKGEAIVDVIELPSRPSIILIVNGKAAVIQKPGLYQFRSGSHQKRISESALYAWSKMRAEQLSTESAASAQTYPGNHHALAWYWNPLFGSYTLMPPSGIMPPYRGGDSYLYGPPIPEAGLPTQPATAARNTGTVPTIPLTAPGVPIFRNSRGRL